MNQVKDFIEYLLNAIKIWIIVMPWQAGVRVRGGKKIKKLTAGIYFRIPYLDSIYIQEIRLRVVSLPMQTLTTKDGHAVTMLGALGYSIVDIEKMYKTLYHPELTLANMAMSTVSECVYEANLSDITPSQIEAYAISQLEGGDYGVNIEYFKLTNFAVVKTYRLIQDGSWVNEGIKLDVKS